MNKRVRNSLSGALWIFTVAVFLLGVLYGYAGTAWLLFLVAAGLQALLEAFYDPKKVSSDESDM